MKFSIITPSFRNSEWLKLCIASVADQSGVELEHIVQDSCSDDGTQLTFCYGGTPYTVTCADYGFTQCLAGKDDSGAPFAGCRF